jgi:glycosyltransferase EpsE
MDGDDICDPRRIEKQVAFLDNNPNLAEVGSAYIRFDEQGEFGVVSSPTRHNRKQMMRGVPSCHACIMMRKEVYDAIGGYTVLRRTERCEDVDMWYKFYAAGFEGANLPEPLYKVRDNRQALKRRKLKYDIDAVKTNLIGYKILNYPIWCYPLAFRQVVSHFVPYKLKVWVRTRLAKRANM